MRMHNLMKKQIWILVGGLILLGMQLVGCSAETSAQKTGLHVYSMSTSIGAVHGNETATQKVSYSITLTNEGDQDIYVKSIKPILAEKVSDRVTSEELIVIVEKPLTTGQNIEIKGEFIMNTAGLSKEEIVELGPFITNIQILSEEILELPSKQQGQN